jgi:hypothetical protein
MDQCKNCECRGNISRCLHTECFQHESWMVNEIKGLTKFSLDHIAQEPANQADHDGGARLKKAHYELKRCHPGES